MAHFKQWQIVRVKTTGELATVLLFRRDGKIAVVLNGGNHVTLDPDSLAPVNNTQAESEARSERAFRRAVLCVLAFIAAQIVCALIFHNENQIRYATGGLFCVLSVYIGYFFFKNTRKPEPPLS